MPNWKKVIISGSDAVLNEITSSGGVLVQSDNDGNAIFMVSGSNGQLVKVTDTIDQSLFQVNNLSGITHFEVSSSGTLIAENLESSEENFVLTYNSASGRIYFASSSAVGGGGADNLGNHTATTNLNMSNNNVTNIASLDGTFTQDLTINVGGSDDLFVSAQNINLNDVVYLTNGGIVSASTAVSSSDIYTTNIRSLGAEDSTRINLGGGQIVFFAGGGGLAPQTKPNMSMNLAQGIVLNDQQHSNFDFRVEGDTDANLIFADAGENKVAIGTNTVGNSLLTIDGDATATNLTASNILLADKIVHNGDNNTYLQFAGADDFRIVAGGKDALKATSSEIAFNDGQANYDFRVEGDTDANLIFADASTDRVGIGTATPGTLLDVNGTITADDIVLGASMAHETDTDTRISFSTNQIFMATDSDGDSSIFIGEKYVQINDNNAGYRDFVVNGNTNNLILASGSLDRVYIKGRNNLLDKTLNVQGEVTASDVFIDDWGSVSASLANAGGTLPDTGPGAGTYGSTSDSTKIDQITLDAQGRVTAISTGATGNGDITGVTAGTNLNGGGTSGTVTLNLDNPISKVGLRAAQGNSSAPGISFFNGTSYGWYDFKLGTQAAYIGFAENGNEQMKHNADGVEITSDYAFSVGVSPSTTNGRIDASNDIVAFSSSDIRWKENIKPIENALDKVSQIGGYEFDWKELSDDEKETQHGNTGHDVGVIAQEIEKVLPEVVTTRDNGFMGVKYEKIVPLLIESIKELKAEVEELKRRL